MARHRTTLDDFPNILRQLPGEFTEGAVRGLRSASQELVRYAVEEILDAQAVASGELSRSVRPYPLPDGAFVDVEAPHAAFVEHGTRPHWPPLQPLIDWVIAKGLASATHGDRDRQGRFLPASQRVSSKTQEENARAIARRIQVAIAQRGTKPIRFFRKAVDRIEPEIIEHIIEEWNKI